MKYDKCEVNGCDKKGTRKVKNGHRVCEAHLRKLRHAKKVWGCRAFPKEKLVGNIGGYGLYVDVPVKYA